MRFILTSLISILLLYSNNSFADDYVYLSIYNNSSYETHVTEGHFSGNIWDLGPGESTDSWYWFSGYITNLKLSYHPHGSKQWETVTGCTTRWWYDHSITVTFEDYHNISTNEDYPVCRIRVH